MKFTPAGFEAIIPRNSILRSAWLWSFVALAVLRVIYVAESTRNPLFGVPVVDAHVYDEWAARIAGGHWLWDRLENYLPVYPYFLALLKILFGETPIACKLAQHAMGAFSAILLGWIAARLWGRRAGVTAALLTGANWLLVVYESEEYAESFSIFFQSLALFILIARGPAPRWALAAGLAFGLSAGARANLMLLFPAIAAWLAWRLDWRWKRVLPSMAALTLGLGLVIGPVLIRNHQLVGAWMLRNQAASTLYTSLAPRFDGLPIPPGIFFNNVMREPLRAGLRSEPDIERYWKGRVWTLLREQPGPVAGIVARRVLMMFSAHEFSKEFDALAYRGYSRILSIPGWPGFWLAGPLGALGLLARRKRSREEWLLILWLALSAASILPFKYADRYRMPLTPVLSLFAADAIWRLVDWSRAGRRATLAAGLAALIALCVLSWPDWFDLRNRGIARHDYFIGIHYQELNQLDQAQAAFQRSMLEYPWDADSACRLAQIVRLEGRNEQARRLLDEALRRQPDFPEALVEKARLALDESSRDEAARLTRAALELAPTYEDAYLLMARIAREQGDNDAEARYYEQALANGAPGRVALTLGLRLEDFERYDEALQWYELIFNRTGEEDFQRARAGMLAGNIYARRRNDVDHARSWWARVDERFPAEPFFRPQAAFLSGQMDEEDFRTWLKAQTDPAMEDYGRYCIGLARRIQGDLPGALDAYNQCLARWTDRGQAPRPLPLKWAWEDRRALQRAGNPGVPVEK